MYFVWSSWYIVLAVLLVAIAALVTLIVLMDKKDKAIIEEFANNNTAPEAAAVEATAQSTEKQQE